MSGFVQWVYVIMPHSFEEGKLNKSKSEEVNCFVCNARVGYKHLLQIFFLNCKRVTLIILIPSSLIFDFTFRYCVLNGEVYFPMLRA
jgi:hypothetical protein